MKKTYSEVARLLKNSNHCIFYTGAGISVESGIPPFRGESGLWNKYDPMVLELNYYLNNTKESWKVIKKIFYDFFGIAKPNEAHKVIGRLEETGIIKAVVTQNIDNLHQEGGSKHVLEFHGNSKWLVCTSCEFKTYINNFDLDCEVPYCPECKGLLKPDFIFFGERIPEPAGSKSYEEAKKSDVVVVVGSTGEVIPAAYVPNEAKRTGATIIEINPNQSTFTNSITDIHIKEKASAALAAIEAELKQY